MTDVLYNIGETAEYCISPPVPVSSAISRNPPMIRISATVKAVCAGLLITVQAAGWGFWTYFFLFGERWKLPPSWQLLGALAILAHPAAFFLVAAYSESLFLLALIGFLYWSSAQTKKARLLAAMHGVVM